MARTCIVLLPARDSADARSRLGDLRKALSQALGPELARGQIRFAEGLPRPLAEASLSWAEALAALAGGSGEGPAPSADDIRFDEDEDEDFLRALLEGDQAGTVVALERLLSPLAGLVTVPGVTAGRIASLFGAASRQLARRGLLIPTLAASLLDLGDLAPGGTGAAFALAARTRLARLHEAMDKEARHSQPVARTLAYIRENYRHPIGLELAADAVGMPPNRLSRILVEETGRGFSDFLIEYRIERAKELLAEAGSSVKEVSASCGYPDPNYFSRLFKKVTGLTPTAWQGGRPEDE